MFVMPEDDRPIPEENHFEVSMNYEKISQQWSKRFLEITIKGTQGDWYIKHIYETEEALFCILSGPLLQNLGGISIYKKEPHIEIKAIKDLQWEITNILKKHSLHNNQIFKIKKS